MLSFDITTNVTAAGEIDINFVYTSGVNGLQINSVALLQNGTQVDIDVHQGVVANAVSAYPIYILRLPQTKPGASYTIQANVQGFNGTNCSGTVYLPNWN
jgi:hexosaminidase